LASEALMSLTLQIMFTLQEETSLLFVLFP